MSVKKKRKEKKSLHGGKETIERFCVFSSFFSFFFWKDMEGSGKYGLGHENRIFDNPSFTLERKKKKRKNVSKAMKIDIRDARITGHVGSEINTIIKKIQHVYTK